jgi:hypothetical protein
MRELWDSGRYTYFPGMQGGRTEDGRVPAWAETGPGVGYFGMRSSTLRTALFYGFFNDEQINDPNRSGSAADLGITREQFWAETLLHEIRHYLCPGCNYAEKHDDWDTDIVKYCFK